MSIREQNYWPGFVDALSNVVLTLVFVLVVIVFALMMASNKIEQKIVEISRLADERQTQKAYTEDEMIALRQQLRETTETLQKTQAQVATYKAALEDSQRELTSLKARDRDQRPAGRGTAGDLPRRIEVKVQHRTDPAAPADSAEIGRDAGIVVITFPTGALELDDKARTELAAALAPFRRSLDGTVPVVRSLPGAETYSEGRRLAYFRGLQVRNFMIDHQFGTAGTIRMVLDQPQTVGDGRVEIRFRRK